MSDFKDATGDVTRRAAWAAKYATRIALSAATRADTWAAVDAANELWDK